MRLSISLCLAILTTFLTTSSCNLVTDIDERTAALEKLQQKEWVLKTQIVDGNNVEFTPQIFHFVSDSEFEFSYEDDNGVMQTETHNYTIDFSTNRNVQFNIDAYSLFLIFPVVAITDNSLTIIRDNGAILEFE